MTTHLILFFDCNKTLLLADNVKQADVAKQLSAEFADNPKFAADWDNSGHIQTYRLYAKSVFPTLEQKSAFQSLNQHFLEFLETTHHPHLAAVNMELNKAYLALSALGENQVFDSAINLFMWLEEHHALFSYTIVLRTFGEDASMVEQEIEARMNQAGFADFEFVNHGEFLPQHILKINDTLYQDSIEIIDLVAPYEHQSWQDNYEYWHNNGQLSDFGKLFPVNSADQLTIPIFFDDNIFDVANPEQGIIATPYDNFEFLLEKNQIVNVNPLEALIDSDYYINQVIQTLSLHHEEQPIII